MSSGRLETLVFFVIIILMGVLAYGRNLTWQDEISLWQDSFRKSPNKVRPANNLAKGLLEEGRCQEAVGILRTAIEKDPYYAEPYYNLGLCYVRAGRYDEALKSFKEVVRIMDVLLKGHYGEIPRLSLLIRSHGYMANIYALRGEYDMAIEHFREAIKYAPSNPDLHYNLGITLKKAGRYEEAIREFERVLELKPDDKGARWNLTVLRGLIR